MSYQVGLSASEDDLEVQGEIDFDFFDDNSASNSRIELQAKHGVNDLFPTATVDNCTPGITVSFDDCSGTVRKTSIETVIPSPESYTGNNCGGMPPGYRSFSCSPSITVNNNGDKDPIDDIDVSSSLSSSDSDISTSLTDESEEKSDGEETDSMTDVSPLPSHCNSPLVKSDGKRDEAKQVVFETNHMPSSPLRVPDAQCQKKDGVKFSENVKANHICHEESVDVNKLINAIKKLEVKQSSGKSKTSTPFLTANSKHRKNLTFTNEDVRRIDLENQRLLKKIVTQQKRSKPHFASVYSRPASSAINRQKQQRQIELDNLALLKRLEATKPTRDLSRLQLLNEYDHRSTVSSRASMRSTSQTSSQLSSCRSSARSCGRSSTLTQNTINKSVKHQNLTAKTGNLVTGFSPQAS